MSGADIALEAPASVQQWYSQPMSISGTCTHTHTCLNLRRVCEANNVKASATAVRNMEMSWMFLPQSKTTALGTMASSSLLSAQLFGVPETP
eukprot:1270768-Amphidinium_carterae.1